MVQLKRTYVMSDWRDMRSEGSPSLASFPGEVRDATGSKKFGCRTDSTINLEAD